MTALTDAKVKGMRWIPSGGFRMGSEDFYAEEAPVHSVELDGFWIDEHPVTVAEFRRFTKATGYVTGAERSPDPRDYPDADPELLVPGSLVFQRTAGPVDLRDARNWWAWVPGAFWRRPEGPGSNVGGGSCIPSFTSPSRTPRPTRRGQARSCQPRLSGSTQRAAGSMARCSPGAMSSLRGEG